ncbi:hypothetical protein HY522_07255 [bacterium]|nr:hypothetical protein [bacterium]
MKAAVLFIRSGTLDHSRRLLREARERRRPAEGVDWILILQPGVEKEFQDFIRETGAVVLTYDRPVFSFNDLNAAFGARLSTETFLEAYVPFNNPEGHGYFHILRFLSGLGVPRILIQRVDGPIEDMSLKKFVLQHAFFKALWISETAILVILIPFIALYYLFKSIFMRLQNRLRTARNA